MTNETVNENVGVVYLPYFVASTVLWYRTQMKGAYKDFAGLVRLKPKWLCTYMTYIHMDRQKDSCTYTYIHSYGQTGRVYRAAPQLKTMFLNFENSSRISSKSQKK